MTGTSINVRTEAGPAGRQQKSMRVAMLALQQRGGVAYYSCLLANALSQHLSMMVIVSQEMSGFRFDSRLRVEIIKKDKIGPLPNPLDYRRIFRLVQKFNPDLVHDPAGNACKWSFGLWPLLARHWPLVITEHDPKPHPGMGGFFANLTRRVAWKSADHLIVHGKKCRQILLDAGVAFGKVSTNRHGSFAVYDQKHHAEVAEEENTVLFFGELRPNKGLYRLAAIARRVRAVLPAARFIVAGRKTKLPSRAEIVKVCRTVEMLKSQPGFEVHDWYLRDDEVERLFRRCALVILPYDEASQSGVIPLAYAFGKAVVAFDVGDLGENIVDRKTGLLVRPGDEEAFARAVGALLVNVAQRHEMGRQAYAWAQRELSWDLIACKTGQIYESVLAQSMQ